MRELVRTGLLSGEVKELSVHQVVGSFSFRCHRWHRWTVNVRVYPLAVCEHFDSVRQDFGNLDLTDVPLEVFGLFRLKLAEGLSTRIDAGPLLL